MVEPVPGRVARRAGCALHSVRGRRAVRRTVGRGHPRCVAGGYRGRRGSPGRDPGTGVPVVDERRGGHAGDRAGRTGDDVIQVLPVTGIGDVRPGDDLAALIAAAAPWLADGDVLVVTSKIVSKAEGRLVPVPVDGPEREAARAAVLAQETARTVARRGSVRIVQTHHGFVMAAAGID